MSTAAQATTPATLLVVDDDTDGRDLLCLHLMHQGYAVRSAGSGGAALDEVSRGDVDLVLLDVMLPGVSGLTVLERMRADPATAEVPVIVVTGRTDNEEAVRALELGANDYVTKPVNLDVVAARVRAQLRTRRVALEQSATDVGSVLAGQYRLEAKLGSGTYGTVYRATQLSLDRAVAVKVQHGASVAAARARIRFRREALAASSVEHPNAVAVLDFAVAEGGLPFLVMELLEGRTLAQELKAKKVLEVGRALEVMIPVCDALAAAHARGIVHRDVKPANIFLHRAVWGEVPKVLDFGIAKIMDAHQVDTQATQDGWIVGTPSFMAPERFRRAAPGVEVDGQADVYSLGVTLYLLLSGKLPYELRRLDAASLSSLHDMPPLPLRALAPAVPVALEEAVMTALDADPEERPTTEELRDRLRRLALPKPC